MCNCFTNITLFFSAWIYRLHCNVRSIHYWMYTSLWPFWVSWLVSVTVLPSSAHARARSNLMITEPGPKPLCPYLNKIKHFYTQLELFIIWLPIPVISAIQSNLRSWLAQNLSKRFLNVLVDTAKTTMLGRLFHIATIPLLNSVCVGDNVCVLV